MRAATMGKCTEFAAEANDMRVRKTINVDSIPSSLFPFQIRLWRPWYFCRAAQMQCDSGGFPFFSRSHRFSR